MSWTTSDPGEAEEGADVRGEVRWERMFPDQLEDALAGCPVVYLTYGLCEPHGLYNAVGLDALKVHSLACEAARRHGGIVAPPFYWHIHEMGLEAPWADGTIGDRNPWLTSLPPWVFYQCVWYQLRAAVERGFRAAVLLTGHMPYEHDLRRLSQLFMGHSHLRVWAGSDVELHDAETSDGHAGRYETSLLWAMHPDLVDRSRLEEGQQAEGVMAGSAGARSASRREGELLVRAGVDRLGAVAAALLDAGEDDEIVQSQRRMTIDEAERLWRTEVSPVLPEFVSFQEPEGYGTVRDGSQWAANQRSVFYP